MALAYDLPCYIQNDFYFQFISRKEIEMGVTRSFADYQVIRDGNITLDAETPDREIMLRFIVPDNMVKDNSTARQPILAFKYRPFENSRLKAFINHREILNTSFDVSLTRTYWEAVNLTSALSQFESPVEVKFSCSNGKIRLADIIIWYQVSQV